MWATNNFIPLIRNFDYINTCLKSGFHIIAAIFWIAVNDFSDFSNPGDSKETRTNDPSDRKNHDRRDRNVLYFSDPLAIVWKQLPEMTSPLASVVDSDQTDPNEYMETRLKSQY